MVLQHWLTDTTAYLIIKSTKFFWRGVKIDVSIYNYIHILIYMNIVIRSLLINDVVNFLNESNVLYGCWVRKCAIVKHNILERMYYIEVFCYNNLNYNNEYII